MSPLALWLAVILGVGPAPGIADEEDPAAEARTLYRQATAEFEAGNFTQAAEAFVRAHELSGNPNLLYNAALAYEEAQDYAHALEYLQLYRPLAPAEEHPSLDAEIRRLGKRAEAEREPEPEPPAVAVVPAPRVAEPPPPVDAAPKRSSERVYGPAAATLTAVTVVGAGLAVGFGVAAQRAKQRAYDACEVSDGATVCTADARASSRRFDRYAAVTDASIVVAAVSAVALVTVIGVKAARRAKARRADAKALGWHLGGLGVEF